MITNNITSGRTATYGYDSLNRINSASSQASSGSDCWGDSYGYDRYGNLTTATVTQCTGTALSLSVNGNNRITNSGFTFNASGDELSDGLYSYAWDAEGRMTSGASVTYTYDGEGERVSDSGGTLYWRGAGGHVLAETDTSGNTVNEYIFFGGMRMARRDSSGNVYYYFGNSLGSATITNSSGGVCYDADFYPFGGELAFTNTCSQSYEFAGMHRDSATGLDHTEYRQYSSNLGRWLSPDPSGMAAVSLANPQTWNMYAYVTNNPTNLIDALGLGGYGPGSNACTSTTDVNGQTQCQAATYAAAMAGDTNSGGCMAGEYGCSGTPSENAVAENNYVNAVNQAILSSQGLQLNNGQVQAWVPGSSACSGSSCTYEAAGWVNVSSLSDLSLSQQDTLALMAGMQEGGQAVNLAGDVELVMWGAGVGAVVGYEGATAAAASPYVQYQTIQFGASFTNSVTNGPLHLPSDMASPGAWVGWAAGSWAWWEQ